MLHRWEAVWAAADAWEQVTLAALVVATLGQTAFVLLYGPRPWRWVRPGRAFMFKSAMVALMLWLSLLGVIYLIAEQVTAVAMCALAVAILYQLYALLVSPRRMED